MILIINRPVPDSATLCCISGRSEEVPTEVNADVPDDVFSGSETEEEKLRGVEEEEVSQNDSDMGCSTFFGSYSCATRMVCFRG